MSRRAEKFFKWVWRLNGLLLLALAVAGIIGVAALAANLAIFASHERPAEQLVNVAGADIGERDLRLGGFHPIAGTSLLYAQLAGPSEYVGSGSSGGFGTAHNLLFFDTTTKKAHWLLPNNEQVISSYDFLAEPQSTGYECGEDEAEQRNRKAIAILIELEDATEGPAPHASSRSIAVASPDGRALAKLADRTAGMLGYHQASGDSVLVFYVSKGAAHVLDLDPIARIVRSDGLVSTED